MRSGQAGTSDLDLIGADILGRILVVDDNEGNRDIMLRRLQRQGYTVDVAASGMEALDRIETGDFSLVVLDWMMPEMSGIETLKRIRLTRTGTELPVIIATARSARDDVLEALRLGANDYITKPIDFPVAIARIETLVTSQLGVRMLQQANEAMRDVNQQLDREVREREKAEDKALHMARHDALTGLANRAKFFKALNGAMSDAGRFMDVYCLDLEAFRSINDRHGYGVGDAVLKAVADRLREAAAHNGCAARLGGDEFVVLRILDTAPGNASDFADQLRLALSEPVTVGDTDYRVSVRVDRVHGGKMPKTADEVMRAVDVALYGGNPPAQETLSAATDAAA